MTIDEAVAELTAQIKSVSPDAVVRVKRRSDQEASIRTYAPADQESTIKAATQDITVSLLTNEDLDVQVLVYDIATSQPSSE
jgi:hypothetical protein